MNSFVNFKGEPISVGIKYHLDCWEEGWFIEVIDITDDLEELHYIDNRGVKGICNFRADWKPGVKK